MTALHDLFDHDIELERYELAAGPRYHFSTDRRRFLQLVGGGIALCLLIDDDADAQQRGGRGFGGGGPVEIGAWLHIDEAGQVTVYTGKTEVGQNIRTSLSQVVAEELRLTLADIRLVMADTRLTPPDAGTFGSRTTPDMAARLRRVAAAARELLVGLAAEHWKTDRVNLTVADGKITDAVAKQSLTFGELTKGKKLTGTVAGDIATTPIADWKVAGTSAPKVDARAMVTGKHQYASDINLPGMLHGKVLRPPTLNAKLATADLAPAQALPGVTAVRHGEFIGVAATTVQQAEQALAAIKAEWTSSDEPSSKTLYDDLKRDSQPGGGRGGRGGDRGPQERGSVDKGLEQADHKLKATYTIAYIAHAPLEPRAAVAQWNDGQLTVWTGTQRPFGIQSDLARAFGIAAEKVHVIVPDTGSAYGGKHTNEAAAEAARLAKAAGHPVKLVWTREEEFTWAYFRPAGVIEVEAGVTNDGKLVAWDFHNYNSGGSSIQPLYDIPNVRTTVHSSRSPLKQGSYRALAATANTFARECHLDDLAQAAGLDPLQLRLRNLTEPRLRAVLEAATEKFGWQTYKPGHGRAAGLACGSEKGSYVATVAEVAVDQFSSNTASVNVQVLRAVTAFECGAIINPEHLKNQVEGCVMMGLGGALFEAIDFDNGKIITASFTDYRVPRFSDLPDLETVLVNRPDLPSAGAGETPIITIAPAVANALHRATGKRSRSLPLLRSARVS